MRKSELIRELAVSEGLLLSTATKAVDGVLRIMRDTLVKGEDVNLRDLGRFCPVDRKERLASDFNTGLPVVIPAHRDIKFKISKTFKTQLNNGTMD